MGKLDVNKPDFGDGAALEAAAQAAQQLPLDPMQEVQGAMGAAAQEGAAEVARSLGENQPPAPAASASPQAPQPFVQGVMQAPAVMQQPLRTPFERDQEVAIMWDVVSRDRGTALTQHIQGILSGVE